MKAITPNVLMNTDKLKKLIEEQPDYPIVFLAGEDANAGDWSYMYCTDVRFEVDEILDCEQTVNDERIYNDRQCFKEDLEDWMYNKGMFDGLSETEQDALEKKELEKYDPYWKKCICIYVDN